MVKYVKCSNTVSTYEYSYTGNLKDDREYFIQKYSKQGKNNIKVKRVKTDTKGLPMYEITWDKE